MDVYEAIRIKALRDVVKKDDMAAMRRVFRWYSHEYHTPLHIVEDLPIEHVLLTYWENHYEDLDDSQLEKEVAEAVKTEEEKRREELEYDARLADTVEFNQHVSKNLPSKIADIKTEPPKGPMVPDLQTQQPLQIEQEKVLLSEIKELPPDIHMKFEVPEDFDGDSIPVPEKLPK